VRRAAYLFYIVLILFGVAGGFIFGDLVAGMVNDAFDIGMSSGAATGILAVIGLIAGIWLAHHFEDDYTHADNGIVWLFMGFLSMVLPLLVALVLGLVAAVVVAIISFVLSILSVIFALVCICSMCNGS
jgi:hypothetical protein